MIDAVELFPIALPFRRPYVTTRGTLERREMVVVRLHSAGKIGSGEAVPLSLRGDRSLGELVGELERCRELLVGAQPGATVLSACAAVTSAAPALAAIDVALLDLAGQLADKPAWQLLGANDPRPVTCNATLVQADPDRLAHDALEWFDRGFRSFKLKTGGPDDVAAVRDAVGGDAKIRIDLNAGWSTDEAVTRLRSLEPYDVELAEQPVPSLADLAAVRARQPIPIAADESVASVDDADQAARLEACDFATVKLAKVGGLGAAREIASLLPVYLSSALDGPAGIAAAAHLAQVIPDCGLAHGLATELLFSEGIASASVPLTNGALYPGNDPGLGVELDERALSRLAVDVG